MADNVLSLGAVFGWIESVEGGRVNVRDGHRSGRNTEVTTPELHLAADLYHH